MGTLVGVEILFAIFLKCRTTNHINIY